MIIIDIIIASLIGFALYKGFKQGLVVALISLVSLVVGVFAALKFSFLFREWILEKTQWNVNMVTIAAFVFTFLLVLICIQFLGKFLTKILKTVALGGINRILGAIFLGVKMILIVSVILNIFQKINFNNLLASEETLNTSMFYKPIESFSKMVFPLMDEWYKLALEKASEEAIKYKQKTTD